MDLTTATLYLQEEIGSSTISDYYGYDEPCISICNTNADTAERKKNDNNKTATTNVLHHPTLEDFMKNIQAQLQHTTTSEIQYER